MLKQLVNVLNYTIIFTKKERGLFYKIMASQLRAGSSPGAAAMLLANELQTTKNITLVATLAAQREVEGAGLVEGLSETNYFPPDELGVMRVAEQKGVLKEAFTDLEQSTSARPSFMKNVVSSAMYFLIFAGIFYVLGISSGSFFYALEPEADTKFAGNIAFEVGTFLGSYGILIASILAIIIILLVQGRATLEPSLRWLLGIFDKDYRLLFALEYSQIAEIMYRQGASHQEVMELSSEALGSARFKKRALEKALNSHVSGTLYELALQESSVLYEGHKKLIQSLSVGGTASNYANAFKALSEIIFEMLVARYKGFSVGLQALAGI